MKKYLVLITKRVYTTIRLQQGAHVEIINNHTNTLYNLCFLVPHVSGKDLRIHVCPCVCASVTHFLLNRAIFCYVFLHEALHSENLKSDDFGFLTKIQNWPFFGQKRSKCLFWPISPKRFYKCSLFSPEKHIFWSFQKWRKFFWGGNYQNFRRFLTKMWPFWAKYVYFGPFLPNATINVPHFRHRNIFLVF